MPRLFAGTSGFSYAGWKPVFYPPKLPSVKFLEHYASRLNSTEINYTYHRLPSTKSLESWVESTPSNFVFSLKAHMKLTHVLRLKGAESFLELFLKVVDPLRVVGRLGPILFQLPPNMKCDEPVLDHFLSLLPADLRYTFEFRNQSWLAQPVYDMLARRGVCLCLAESDKLVVPEVLTAPFVYLRLRKPGYSPEDRTEIAARVRELLAGGRDVYLYFKHEDTPDGALYAEELLRSFRPAAATMEG